MTDGLAAMDGPIDGGQRGLWTAPTDPTTLAPDGPDALGRELAGGPAAVAATLAEVDRASGALRSRLDSADRIVLIGTGASLAAARTAAALWRSPKGRRVTVCESTAVAFGSAEVDGIGPGDAAIAVSKSGSSPETLWAARRARQAGASVAVVTAVGDSPLAAEADAVVLTPIGVEEDASTRSELAATAALLALGGSLRRQDGERIVAALTSLVADWEWSADAGRRLADARHVWFLGFGSGLGLAAAGALLWHEKVRRPAIAATPSDFRHGFIEASGPEDAVVMIDPDDADAARSEYLAHLADELLQVGVHALRVGPAGASDAERALAAMLRIQQLSRAAAHAAGTYRDGFEILRAIVSLGV